MKINLTSPREFLQEEVEKKYYLGFSLGLITLIITIVIIVVTKADYLAVITYPTIAYFILQQVLAGFGFITGYIPVAQWIIKQLKKSAKKKQYSEKDLKKIDEKCKKLEEQIKEREVTFKKKLKELDDQELNLNRQIKNGELVNKRKIRKVRNKINGERKKLEKEYKDYCKKNEEERKNLLEQKKEYRGKREEELLKKQEENPTLFKLILIVPLYVMTAVGIFLSIWAIVQTIIYWITGSTESTNIAIRTFNALDMALTNDIYKGILSCVAIFTFYLLPSIWLLKDPEKPLGPKVYKGFRRKVSDWWKRKVTKDHRTLLQRQFDDLRRLYWEVKQIIGNALLIPMGIAEFALAPIGGLAIALGVKKSFEKENPLKKYEHVFMIIVSITFIGLLLFMHIAGIARTIRRDFKAVFFISRLIYGLSIIASFVVFTRMPISDVEKF